MNLVERVMRVMTHINIGSALGLAAWVLWPGSWASTGPITPGPCFAEVQTLIGQAPARESEPKRLGSARAESGALPPCQNTMPRALR